MPLLKKKPFIKNRPPEGLRDDDEVFHCVQTDEIFRDYAEFSERVILCNSMVWTCSLTGKTGLTYTEALESEENAKKMVKDFPNELKIPALYLANRTKRTSFMDMADDVFSYMKDRFFIGENVEASFGGSKWREAHVLQVIGPLMENVEKISPKNGHTGDKRFKIPAHLYNYEVEQYDADDEDVSEIMIVDSNHIKRKKSHYTKEKNKLFLKMHSEQNSSGLWVIKDSVLSSFGIKKVTFDQISDGPPPEFEISKRLENKKHTVNGKKAKQETLSEFLSKNNGTVSDNNLLAKMRQKELEFKKRKELREAEKLAERDRLKEQNLRFAKILKDWHKPKEDLELEDHRVLPTPTPVITKIPDKYMGDVFMILEFVYTFTSFLSAKRFFPQGLTVELMERALLEKEVAGPLIDILQMFLIGLFNVEEEETEQYKQNKVAVSTGGKEILQHSHYREAIALATMASKWSESYQGMSLKNLLLCPVTASEILRLHLLSSGARTRDARMRWRYQHRGGYRCEDDPGLHLRMYESHILKALAARNVTELPIDDKLKIMKCLMDQLLTYADLRDVVEEQIESAKQAKLDLKHLQSADRKSEQEYLAARLKLKRNGVSTNADITVDLDKLLKERLMVKGRNEKKIHQLMKKATVHLSVMGQDRAFRRYVKLESVPGFFVENDETEPGRCLDEPVTQNPQLIGASRSQLMDHIRKTCEELNTSDKENDPNKSSEFVNGAKVANETYNNLTLCDSNPDTCPVHSTLTERQRWFFYHEPEKLDKLVTSLNRRGIRESELQQLLMSDQDALEEIIKKCPVNSLNANVQSFDEEHNVRTKKPVKNRYENSNFGYPEDFTTSQVLRESLTEHILELEEKIHYGGLGGLKVEDRQEWRKCLQNYDYAVLDKTIDDVEEKSLHMEVDKKEDDSRPGTPDEDISIPVHEDPGKLLDGHSDIEPEEPKPDVTDTPREQLDDDQESFKALAIALVQVAQGIEKQFIKAPLGSAALKKTQKERHDYLDKWMKSLLIATTYSQIFVHYNTLDGCIMWSRSARYAKCQVCKSKTDYDNMLLCEVCNVGQHLQCFRPKLTAVPQEDWFCDSCQLKKNAEEKNRPQNRPQRKTRKLFNYNDDNEVDTDDDYEEEEEEEEEVEAEPEQEPEAELEEELVVKENGVTVEESEEEFKDVELKSEDEEEIYKESEDESDEISVSLDVCAECKSGGTLICCDKCPDMYHLECIRPPMRRVPRGQWFCPKCRHSASDSGGSDTPILTRHSRSMEVRDDLPLHNSILQELLSEILKHDDGWAFIRPVAKNEVPDYYEVIQKPMDFGTIKYKLNMGEYKCDADLMEDVILVFNNCDTYNDSNAEVYKCGVRLLKFFVKRCRELGLKVPEELVEEGDNYTPKAKRRRIK